MKALATATVLLVASVALASPTPMITPPAGWTADAEQAAQLATKVNAQQHLGGATVVAATEVYLPPTPGVALFVTRITANTLVGPREQAARAAIDDLHASAAQAYDWRVLPSGVDKVILAHGEWTDASVSTQTLGTVVIAASASRFVTVRGECLSSEAGSPEAIHACGNALRTLDPGIPVDERIAFEPADQAAPPVPTKKLDEPARITDGQNVHLSPMTIAASKPEADRRPVYLGAGIVVMAAVFWWNRRRRERFEREDEGGTAGTRRGREPTSQDDDADDLAAAARGDEPKDET
jgi:hypothetical protein